MAKKPTGPVYAMDFAKDEAFSFDIDAFRAAIEHQGVSLVLYYAQRCPVGLIDPDDIRRPHEHHQNCSNGFIYTKAGTFTGLFMGNSKQNFQIDPGVADGSSVVVTAPRFFDKCAEEEIDRQILPAPFDRIYLAEESIVVVHWQLFQAQANKIDRVSFPIVDVVNMIDTDGKIYKCGKDFKIKDGAIYWGKNWPGLDPQSNKGKVVSIRYTYRPYWYVKQMLHEIRVTQAEDELGDRQVIRMPQQFLLQREYVYLNEMRDDKVADQSRQELAPPSGIFGPR